MDGYCRGCLTKYADTSQLVQYSEKIRHLYTYSTGLQVKPNDPLFQLCKHCIIKMKLACKFKKQCRNADKKFCHFITASESGEMIDFDTFLQTYQENNSFPLKFPLNGSSTPSYLKAKDDDNESVCTSIRNFMTDILRAEDLPDTEAKIIQEMIEKEADVLNDTLDSAWLADDSSVVTDFRFSPFSTPTKNDLPEQNYTPLRTVENDDKTSTISSNSSASHEIDQETYIAAKKILLNPPSAIENQNIGVKKHIDSILTVENEFAITVDNNIDSQAQESIGKVIVQMKEKDVCEIVVTRDRIDQNLEEALKDAATNEFPLDSLIAISTPSVKSGIPGGATPLIADILFGNETNNENRQTNKHVYCTDDNISEKPNGNVEDNINDEESDVDILGDFFNKETGEYIGDNRKELTDSLAEFLVPKVPKVPNLKDGTENAKDGTQNEIADGDFTCKICKKECLNTKSLRIHSRVKHKITLPKKEKKMKKILAPGQSKYDLSNFSCIICDKTFKHIPALKIHFTMVHKTKIETPKKTEERVERTCDRCGMVFHRRSNLYAHIRAMHKKSLEVYKCDKCGLVCTSASKLKMHSRTHGDSQGETDAHEKLLTCNECGVSFAKPCNLAMHIMRKHTKEYKAQCDFCPRKYFRKSDLMEHRRIHTGERPFSCPHCPRIFRRRDTLNNHMKRHTNERPYQCEFCKNNFPSRSILNAHQKNSMSCMKIQTNENVPEREDSEYVVLENVNNPENLISLEDLLGVSTDTAVRMQTEGKKIIDHDHDYSNMLYEQLSEIIPNEV